MPPERGLRHDGEGMPQQPNSPVHGRGRRVRDLFPLSLLQTTGAVEKLCSRKVTRSAEVAKHIEEETNHTIRS